MLSGADIWVTPGGPSIGFLAVCPIPWVALEGHPMVLGSAPLGKSLGGAGGAIHWFHGSALRGLSVAYSMVVRGRTGMFWG